MKKKLRNYCIMMPVYIIMPALKGLANEHRR